MDKKPVSLDTIVSLAKRRGFVYPGSEIYGGLAGTFDYGPLGVTLKKNIENLWWRTFVEERDDMYGIDAAILMNPKAWEASGHVEGFSDPLVECKNCNQRQRVDQIVNEEQYKFTLNAVKDIPSSAGEVVSLIEQKLQEAEITYDKQQVNLETLRGIVEKMDDFENYVGSNVQTFLNKHVQCPVCGAMKWGEPRRFNMMFATKIGAADAESSTIYLRPETAGGIFVNFKNVVDSFHPKLPFGIAQIGKAFRNEIAPREFVFRVRELEQMEVEYFVRPGEWQEAFELWREKMLAFGKALGLPDAGMHELEVEESDRAHYSKRTIDFEFDFPFGRRELWGLAYRTDFDLSAHQEHSSQKLEYLDDSTGEKFLPHVIEPSLGVGRTMLAALASAYHEDDLGGETRVVLKLPAKIAPVKAMVSPLLKNKAELVERAKEVRKELQKIHPAIAWDDNGNIGKRYRRQDEIGTPFCITIDFDTLENGTVTLRDRDSGEQERLTVEEVKAKLEAAI